MFLDSTYKQYHTIFVFLCLTYLLSMINSNSIHVTANSIIPTSWEELTHWKRLWRWEGLGAGEEGQDDRGWDGWMASLTRWTWVWVNSGSWWWTGSPGVLQFMGLQRVRHDWATELNWTESFLWLSNTPLYICIHSCANRHSGCFHVLAIINSAAMNTGMHVSFQIMAFLQIQAQEWDCWIIW